MKGRFYAIYPFKEHTYMNHRPRQKDHYKSGSNTMMLSPNSEIEFFFNFPIFIFLIKCFFQHLTKGVWLKKNKKTPIRFLTIFASYFYARYLVIKLEGIFNFVDCLTTLSKD